MSVPPDLTGRPAPFCALCGARMEVDQEWCLQCGAARTVIARPPDWRVPLLVIGAVVLIIAGVLVFAVSQLTHNAGKVTVVDTTVAATNATLATWPPGLDGYTVLLSAAASQTAARRTATRLSAARVSDVGVLAVAQHPQMRFKGPWLVFSGRYPTYALAKAAAGREVSRGQARAIPALVQQPGGG